MKTPNKDNYHIPNSYRPNLLPNMIGKTYEKIILQEAVDILTKSKFFNGKNIYAYQKYKNAPRAFINWVDVRGNCKW